MEKIKSLIKQPLILGGSALLIGMIFGLVVLGWVVWPLEWINGAPVNLSPDYQRQYLCMVIDSFVRNQDQNLMRVRWSSLGNGNIDLLKSLTSTECRFTSNAEIDSFKTIMNVTGSPSTIQTPNSSVPVSTSSRISFLPVLLFCLLTLVAGGSLLYILNKKTKLNSRAEKKEVQKAVVPEEHFVSANEPDPQESLNEKPMAQFMASYRIGQDLYDESFSIDSSSGEFLGECGLGIAESIGVGDPKKVSALEMWLFDKNDIQTATKVLMSEHAFNDEATLQRLVAKGEPILIKPGQHFIMETSSLQLEATVINLVYGRGPLPENSFFSQLTLEISVFLKVH
jgi:hypothetical protein